MAEPNVLEAPERLSESELEEELGMRPLSEEAGSGPAGLVEGNAGTRLVVPRKGKLFDDDGVCEVVVIRPCVSRGKRIRGLPPIYTPQMLQENASVYSGWLMYMDHLTEKIIEALQVQEGRKIRELGGRVLKSWWDPGVRFKDDADFGFQPGGVVARALPQPPVRAMLEADPLILNVSHNAWPTGATKSKAPWDANLEGYLIEGIRSKPEGSVDWVPRGGAGGRVRLQEWEEFAVSVLGSYYGSPRRESEDEDMSGLDLTKITEADLRKELLAKAPALAEALGVEAEPSRSSIQVPSNVLTAEDLKEALEEQARTFQTQLSETQASAETRAREIADSLVEQRGEQESFSKKAKKLIESAGLPSRWTADLLRRYSVLPSGPSAHLSALLEADEPDDALKAAVEEDVQHARDLIEEAGGVPSVRGLGGKGGQVREGRAERDKKRTRGAFREFLAESEKDPEKRKAIIEGTSVKEMVSEGIEDVHMPSVEG